jgi:SAM-dependent methyltransferase
VPSLDENRGAWAGYDWKAGGDEWSEVWGGAAYQWWATLFPRIHSFLPTGTVLEIAPGYGRWTQFLAPLCRKLVIVDVTQKCIDACRERFASYRHIEYHVNDGKSLPAMANGSVDFAFSFDSLVHLEADVIRTYLEQLAPRLAPEGVAFFHHSNFGSFVDPATGTPSIENQHWRASSVSAAGFAELCREAGLVCCAQELVNWGGEPLTDCLSLVTRPGSALSGLNLRTENPQFMAEAQAVRRMAEAWGPVHAAARPPAAGKAPDGWLARSARRLGFR